VGQWPDGHCNGPQLRARPRLTTQHKALYLRSPVGELWVARAPRGAPQDWRKWVEGEG
jgi:hypothetical protein